MGITRCPDCTNAGLTVCDMNENSSKSAEPLIDADSNLWYADEITAVLTDGLMKKTVICFIQQTFLHAVIASSILPPGWGFRCSVPYHQENQTDSLGKWLQYFDLWLSQHEMAITRTLTIEALPSGDSSLTDQVKTDSGIYSSQGLVLEPYLGQPVTAYIVGDQMLIICPKKDTHPEIMNVTETDSLTFHETNTAQPDPKTKMNLRYPNITWISGFV
ncbi:MAG: hypothetical protein ACLR1V_10050 [Coprococcus sp.]